MAKGIWLSDELSGRRVRGFTAGRAGRQFNLHADFRLHADLSGVALPNQRQQPDRTVRRPQRWPRGGHGIERQRHGAVKSQDDRVGFRGLRAYFKLQGKDPGQDEAAGVHAKICAAPPTGRAEACDHHAFGEQLFLAKLPEEIDRAESLIAAEHLRGQLFGNSALPQRGSNLLHGAGGRPLLWSRSLSRVFWHHAPVLLIFRSEQRWRRRV